MEVRGNHILIVGDLHFSDVFTGDHVNYLNECYDTLEKITKQVETLKPAALILAGDLIGYHENNIRSREHFINLCKYFMKWNTICPVFSVRGNHDLKGYPDFRVMNELKLFLTSKDCGGYIDYYTDESADKPSIRFHLVDYGAERQPINTIPNVDNVVVGHANYYVSGVTTWYVSDGKIEVSTLDNFRDVKYIISGHIHVPSPNYAEVRMSEENTCYLFYLGCPTRPIKVHGNYDMVWFVDFPYEKAYESCYMNPIKIDLDPMDKVFVAEENIINDDNSVKLQNEIRKEALANVLADLTKYQVTSGDILTQLQELPKRMTISNPKSVEMATQYVKEAIGVKDVS